MDDKVELMNFLAFICRVYWKSQ